MANDPASPESALSFPLRGSNVSRRRVQDLVDWIGRSPAMGKRELNLTFPASGDLYQSPPGAGTEGSQTGGSANVRLGTSDTRRRVIAAPGRRCRATTLAPRSHPVGTPGHSSPGCRIHQRRNAPCCGDASVPNDGLPNQNLLARSRGHLPLLDPMPTDSLLYCMSPAGYVHGRAY